MKLPDLPQSSLLREPLLRPVLTVAHYIAGKALRRTRPFSSIRFPRQLYLSSESIDMRGRAGVFRRDKTSQSSLPFPFALLGDEEVRIIVFADRSALLIRDRSRKFTASSNIQILPIIILLNNHVVPKEGLRNALYLRTWRHSEYVHRDSMAELGIIGRQDIYVGKADSQEDDFNRSPEVSLTIGSDRLTGWQRQAYHLLTAALEEELKDLASKFDEIAHSEDHLPCDNPGIWTAISADGAGVAVLSRRAPNVVQNFLSYVGELDSDWSSLVGSIKAYPPTQGDVRNRFYSEIHKKNDSYNIMGSGFENLEAELLRYFEYTLRSEGLDKVVAVHLDLERDRVESVTLAESIMADGLVLDREEKDFFDRFLNGT